MRQKKKKPHKALNHSALRCLMSSREKVWKHYIVINVIRNINELCLK